MGEFSALLLLLLLIGNGWTPVDPADGKISIRVGCGNIVQSIEELKDKVARNIARHYTNTKWLCECAILALKNKTVNTR